MCKYIIKHYWNDTTAEATITPQWITSSEALNTEQQKVKALVNRLLSASNYNRLSREKPTNEKVGEFEISYTYRDKKDPHPSRNRMVTDITICIKKRINYLLYIVSSIIIALLLFGFYFKNSNEQETTVKKERNITQPQLKTVVEKNIPSACNIDEFNVVTPDKCWQYFVQYRCKNGIVISYDRWLQTNSLAQCVGVDNLESDEDYNVFEENKKFKKIEKQEFKKFMKGII